MSVAFETAWTLLKNAPMSEKEFYNLEDDDEGMGGPNMPPSRTVGGTPPANIGRAGNSQMTFPSHSLTEGEIEGGLDDLTPPNPFPKPLASRVQDQLAQFADGAGRRAAMKPPMDDKPSMIEESHPEAHNIKRKV